ncbi:MAG: hypothetical protein E4H22_02500 [Solirubrobacterales bacterium]|nr:MAG: hypothetical protein E4H22_02500 [Solirubrobacterales bacterium]
MPWTETESLSFIARHEEGDEECAERTLDALEDLRLRLEDRLERAPGDVTIIIHPSAGWLAAAHPFLPAARLAAAPAGRRYLAGWAIASEVHVLNDEALERRAGGEDSLRALLGTASRLYAQLTLASHNERMPPPWGPASFVRYLRWAWLVEGGAQYLAGQVGLFRPAVGRRLSEGDPPSFPPGPRDAIILGGTVFDLLEREVGAHACDLQLSRLRKDGAERALENAFGVDAATIEGAWRRHLTALVDREAP